MTPPNNQKSRTRQTIYEAIVDLVAQEQPATRKSISAVTGLKLTLVDEHCNNMVDDEVLMRDLPGIFRPVERFPLPRAISTTILPSTWIKLEVGDTVMDLTPREARMLGQSLVGFGMQYSMIQFGQEVAIANAHNDVVIKEARRRSAGKS